MSINILDPTDKVAERFMFSTSAMTARLTSDNDDMNIRYADLPDRSITSTKGYLYHDDIQRECYQLTFDAPFSELLICGRTADADKFGVAIGGLRWSE